MSVDRNVVEHVAYLARIAVSEDELSALPDQLSSILALSETLRNVDTKDVQPMRGATNEYLRYRSDNIGECVEDDELMSNAPNSIHGYFSVPRMIE